MRGVAIVLLCVAATADCKRRMHDRESPGGNSPTASASDVTSILAARLREATLRGAPEAESIAHHLASRGATAIGDALILLGDPDARVAEAGADVLEEIGTDSALDALVTYSSDVPEDRDLRARHNDRLVRLGRRAMAVLDRGYRASPDVRGRLRILHAVQKLDDRSALSLLRFAVDDPDHRLAATAEWILGQVAGPEACAELVARLRAQDPLLREGAIIGIRLAKDRGAVAHLIHVLIEPDVRYTRSWFDPPETHRIHEEAAVAIDALTGERIGEDPRRARVWLEAHHPATSCPKP